MRLAVVSPFVDRRHGTERALAELLERLARTENCEIHFYAQRVEDLLLNEPGIALPQKTGTIIWHPVPSVAGPHLLQFLFWFFANPLCRRWDRWVRGLRFELVLSPGINCLDADVVIVHVLFHRLRELARAKEFAAGHLGFLRGLHRRMYYALLTALEQRIYADPKVAVVAVSQRTAGLLAQYFLRKGVSVIPNAVDAAKFCPAARRARQADAREKRNIQEKDFVLLLIGNDWRAKGVETVLRAMAALSDLPLRLIVAGEDAPDSFREYAKSLGLLKRCYFEPPRQDVLDFYAAADLYVSPSLEDSFGMPVVEAMACGLPVITSMHAGVSEWMQDGMDGFILRDPRDSRTLTGLLEKLYSSTQLRNEIGEAAAKTAAHMSWDRNAAEVWALLKDVAARKHHLKVMPKSPK